MNTEVWAGMATLLERKHGRRQAIESLLPQVNRLTVTPGDGKGDQMKFASCAEAPGFFFAVDDDLVYPPDFVERTLEALDRHPGSVVGYHGWNITPDGKRAEEFRSLRRVDGEHQVHVLATCACAFHVDTIRPTLADFPMIMADVWLAVKAASENVPLIVLPHAEDFFGYVQPQRTIWDETQARTGSDLDASESTDLAVRELVELHHGETLVPA